MQHCYKSKAKAKRRLKMFKDFKVNWWVSIYCVIGSAWSWTEELCCKRRTESTAVPWRCKEYRTMSDEWYWRCNLTQYQKKHNTQNVIHDDIFHVTAGPCPSRKDMLQNILKTKCPLASVKYEWFDASGLQKVMALPKLLPATKTS